MNILKKMKIGTRLIIFFLLCGIIPLAVVGILSYKNAKAALTEEAYHTLEAVAKLKETRINQFFFERKGDAEVFAAMPLIEGAVSNLDNLSKEAKSNGYAGTRLTEYPPYKMEFDKYHNFMKFYNDVYGYYDVFLISPNSGRILASAAMESDFGSELKSESHHLAEAWKKMKQTKKIVLTDTEPYAPSNDAPAMFVVAPANDENGNYVGGIAFQISQEAIDGIMRQADGMGETGDTYLVGSDYLFRSNSRLTTDETLLTVEVNTSGSQECFRSKSVFTGIYGDYTTKLEAESQGGRDYSDKLGGVPVLGYNLYLPELDWVLMAEVDEAEAFDKINSLKSIMMIIGIIAAGIVGVFGFTSAKSITKPINNVVAMLKDMAEGEGDLTVRLNVDSKDELGDVANWFNLFVSKLQDVIKQVVASTVQLGDASGEISSTSEQLAAGAEEQQAQLSEVATSMEEMSAMILQSSKNASGTQENASQADQAAGEGRNAVKETIVGIEGIASIVNSASVQISALEQQSKDIGDVIQVIDDIADQTNLLALNANIEAARAGDAGRGFAVVADEVRKLAERTVNATAEIGEKIKKIQSDVGNSVSAMVKITDQSAEGQKLAGLSGKALEDIAQSIAGVNSAVIQISTAADEQSTGAEEISRNIESVSSVSKEAAISSQQLASSSEQLNREVTGLSSLMGKFRV